MNIFIVGPAGTGKSTVARAMAEVYVCPAAETSQVLVRNLAELFAAGESGGKPPDYWRQAIDGCKEEYRQALVQLGDLITSLRPSALIEACVGAGGHSVIAGVRRACEIEGYLTASQSPAKSVWIKVRRPRQPPLSNDRYELELFRPHYEIINDGTLEDLEEMARDLAAGIQAR